MGAQAHRFKIRVVNGHQRCDRLPVQRQYHGLARGIVREFRQ